LPLRRFKQKNYFNFSLNCNSVTLALLNGVPDAQRDLLEQEGGHPSIADFIKNNLEFIMTQLPIKDNVRT